MHLPGVAVSFFPEYDTPKNDETESHYVNLQANVCESRILGSPMQHFPVPLAVPTGGVGSLSSFLLP